MGTHTSHYTERAPEGVGKSREKGVVTYYWRLEGLPLAGEGDGAGLLPRSWLWPRELPTGAWRVCLRREMR